MNPTFSGGACPAQVALPPRAERSPSISAEVLSGPFFVKITPTVRALHRAGDVDPAETGLEPAADGKMWLDGRFRWGLEAANLAGFEATMQSSAGECLRVLEDRENWRLELPLTRRSAGGFYLKKHRVRSWASRFRALLGTPPGETAGRVEARNIRRLAEEGIGVMRLVAYGEELQHDGRLESFVLTEELEGYIPLDDFLRRRFADLRTEHSGPRDRELTGLIRQVAAVARKFHQAGYNHRDFYGCHFFVKEAAPGQFEIRLIDLQRMQHRRRFRRRWLLKDLAQLAYSAPQDRVKCTHKLAFMKHYLGVGKLRARHKRLIRQILAKQQIMERKLGGIA